MLLQRCIIKKSIIEGLEVNGKSIRKKSLRRNEPWRSMERLSSFNSSNSTNWKNSWNSKGSGFGPLAEASTSMRYSSNQMEFHAVLRRNFCSTNGRNSRTSGFRISEEVRQGVEKGEAVVALESAIITHGMPFPHNIETALRLQNIIRDQGAIPATIGVIKGTVVVGLSDEEIEGLGKPILENGVPKIKVSRRDLPFALSQKLDGGTTVSSTIMACVKTGIEIFATGGIGGCHRGAETSFDISADLRELGRNRIAVVSAGVKSILDIGRTLEYLETEGVCVVVLKKKPTLVEKEARQGYQNQGEDSKRNDDDDDPNARKDETGKSVQIGGVKFPSFFSAESQFVSPYSLADELEAAHLVNSSINFGLDSGILIAVPIPKEHEAGGQEIERAVVTALEKAEEMCIKGKDMTPFLLTEINRLTSGLSLQANKYLIENNVRVATRIAILLAELRRTGQTKPTYSSSPIKGRISTSKDGCQTSMTNGPLVNSNSEDISHGNRFSGDGERFIDSRSRAEPEVRIKEDVSKKNETNVVTPKTENRRPVVIGGSSLDLILSVKEDQIVRDGRTHQASIKSVPGGVGRNVAEALEKLGHNPLLISAIGLDLFGRELMRHFHEVQMDTKQILLRKGSPTAIYSALLNHQGECEFGLGDMSIHSEITPSVITNKSEVISQASIVILDGNLSVDTITQVMRICINSNVPVWFEPTEVRKAKKILQVPKDCWGGLRYMSPNLGELMTITGIDVKDDLSKETSSSGTNNPSTFDLQQLPSLFSRCFQMFLGLEVILFTMGKDGILVISREDDDTTGSLRTFSYSAPNMKANEIKSVSGAGDCLNAGFISGILENLSLDRCAERGTFCAKKSLQSVNNVPDDFKTD